MMADDGCFCSPNELLGIWTADDQKKRSAQPDSYVISHMGSPSKAGFEYGLSLEQSRSPHQNLEFTTWEEGIDVNEESIKAELRQDKRQARNFMGSASSFFKNGFFQQIEEIMADFKGGFDPEDGGILQAYEKEVRPELEDIQYAIQDAYYGNNRGETAADKAAINNELKEFGLTFNEIYEAQNYLNWLKRGEFYKSSGMLGEVASTVAKAQASYNVSWALFNVADTPRILAPYISKPKVLIKGLQAAFDRNNKEMPDDLLQAIPGLDEKGGRFDPFSLTNKVQQRLAYFLDKADGGDGFTGLRENAFIYADYDATSLEYHSNFGSTGAKTTFGLGRFLMAETAWTAGNYVNLFNVARGKGDLNKLTNFMVYNVIKSTLFGVGSIIPAPLYSALKDKLPDEQKELLQAGMANVAGNGLLKLAGVEGSFSMTEAVQPLSLVLGARAQQMAGDLTKAGTSISRAITDGLDGDLLPAALESFVTLGALSSVIPMDFKNRFGLGSYVLSDLDKMPALRDFFQNHQVMKIMSTFAKGYREEESTEKTYRELAKDILGNKVVKAPN